MNEKNVFKRIGSAWRRCSKCFRAFFIIAAVFLVAGIGTLGSMQSVGKSYELPTQQSGDEEYPSIVLYLTAPDGYSASNINIVDIYINVGAIYTEIGETATIRIARGTSSSSSYYAYTNLVLANVYEELEEDETASGVANANYNWISFAENSSSWSSAGYYLLSTYPYWQLTARTANVEINEIVFVGEDNTLAEEDRKAILIPAEVHSTSVIYDSSGEINTEEALEEASAVVDKQHIPSSAQSSFFCFGEEEAYSLLSISEIRAGSSYYSYNVFNGDSVYNVLGTDILALGTFLFGVSPFGLRIFPFLAAFGILLLGFSLVKKLSGSEKAGLIFAVLYALCGVTVSLGHLGTPLMIGLFFFMASLYTCYQFYSKGMKKANLKSAVPLLLSGLFGAAAILVNGAYVLPVLGVVALFIAGMIRQQKAKHYYLEKAIQEAEEEETSLAAAPAVMTEAGVEIQPERPAKQKVADLLGEYRYKNRVAPAIFFLFLILGGVFLSMIAVLPAYYLYERLYGSYNVLTLLWKAFAGGYVGSNVVSVSQNPLWYILFSGTGDEAYAVTATGILPALAAFVIGLSGIVYAIIRFVKISKKAEKDRSDLRQARSFAIFLAGFLLCAVTAVFAKGYLAFMLAAAVFAFMAAAVMGCKMTRGGKTETAENAAGGKTKGGLGVLGVLLGVLIVFFLVFAVFTFSIPLPASFIGLFI